MSIRGSAGGRLHPIHRGVYAVGHRALTREGAWMAAVLVADGAVLSHRSAAALWGVWSTGRPRVEVTASPNLRPRPRLRIHRAALPPDEVTVGASSSATRRVRRQLRALLRP